MTKPRKPKPKKLTKRIKKPGKSKPPWVGEAGAIPPKPVGK